MQHTEQDIRAVAPGMIAANSPTSGVATAGQPEPEHLRQMAAAGYRTVIDLRHPGERRGFDEAAVAREAGLRYENIPVTPQSLSDADFDRLRELLRDPENRPALVHCASANRVGALMIPYLVLDEHRPLREAVELAQQVGLRSPDLASAAIDYTRAHGGAA